MFPVWIRYFDPLKGVQNKLLDFVESAEETSMAITGFVLQSFEKHNMDVNYVPSYCADNANVNYGETHSVYQFEFLNLEWTEILRHVPTRWLSLTPAISRLLLNWEAMKSYFSSIPNCPKLLSNIFMKDDPVETVLPEIYINFLSNIGSQLEMVVKTLERSDLSILETYKQMKPLSSKIQQRR
ncbi:hypothetical protein B7P43_G06712 [Cryptotermes secundus]|uniref:Uncharacterized protein n=1 Tax=Cryptotermes secundus TaxID=105785 RepID=A0A2J7PSP8_9NEOP|nr:hypothetical protein B7P43_G06712 [Cryptotermes secundus]